MIGGASAFDRFCADIERDAGLSPDRRWLEQRADSIHQAWLETQAENARYEAEQSL